MISIKDTIGIETLDRTLKRFKTEACLRKLSEVWTTAKSAWLKIVKEREKQRCFKNSSVSFSNNSRMTSTNPFWRLTAYLSTWDAWKSCCTSCCRDLGWFIPNEPRNFLNFFQLRLDESPWLPYHGNFESWLSISLSKRRTSSHANTQWLRLQYVLFKEWISFEINKHGVFKVLTTLVQKLGLQPISMTKTFTMGYRCREKGQGVEKLVELMAIKTWLLLIVSVLIPDSFLKSSPRLRTKPFHFCSSS